MVKIPDVLADVLTANRWVYENEPFYIPSNTFYMKERYVTYRLVVDSEDPESRVGETTYTLLEETEDGVFEIMSTDSVDEIIREINRI